MDIMSFSVMVCSEARAAGKAAVWLHLSCGSSGSIRMLAFCDFQKGELNTSKLSKHIIHKSVFVFVQQVEFFLSVREVPFFAETDFYLLSFCGRKKKMYEDSSQAS